jgi:N6-adenosine-specific RNA methylase IME4
MLAEFPDPGPLPELAILRTESEPYLIGTKGAGFGTHGVRGAIVTEMADVIEGINAERREHSRKPEEAHAIVMRRFQGPYLELFARRPHPVFDCYGDALGGFVPA